MTAEIITSVRAFKDLPYAQTNDPRQTLDLYIPVRDSDMDSHELRGDQRPLLVYIHGGAWRTGDKSDYEFLGEHLAMVGAFPTAVLGYRLSTKDPTSIHHPEHLRDCAEAIRWLRSNDGSSYLGYVPDSIFLVGHSAGATMSGVLALQPQWLEDLGGRSLWDAIGGVVGVEGIYDIPSLVDEWPSYIDFIEEAFTSDRSIWTDASPQCHTLPSTTPKGAPPYVLPPHLIIHSPDDELLNTGPSKEYADHIKTMGKDVEFTTAVKGKHDDMLRERAFFDTVIEFVNSKWIK
ncbi:Kynurenine formamidase [Thoreauomyces humboldtii]|nr:Kynurenine formamidase [Thoreauomyces humboldtii]